MKTKTTQPRTSFVEEVLRLYTSLPDTPDRSRPSDRLLAAELEHIHVSFDLIRAALLLGSARRASAARHLPGIRSLHYFLPIVEEVLHQPPDPLYLRYIEQRLRATLDGGQPHFSPSSRGLP